MPASRGHTIIDLEARQLFCERDDRVLFDELDLRVKNGDLLQLAGPNGAGKTTLLRLLSGLNRDYEGELLWNGQPLYDDYSSYAAQRLYQGHLAAVKKTTDTTGKPALAGQSVAGC